MSLGERVVITLVRGTDLKHRQLFFDSYLNSLQLLHRSKKENILATGTIRLDRKYFPSELKEKEKVERRAYPYIVSKRICVAN